MGRTRECFLASLPSGMGVERLGHASSNLTTENRTLETSFTRTYGSQTKGNPTLIAGVVIPRTSTITLIDIKSQTERHTINRAELAAITEALKQENTEDHLSILTNISLCINTIGCYIIDPAS
jgi:hypothetical protein